MQNTNAPQTNFIGSNDISQRVYAQDITLAIQGSIEPIINNGLVKLSDIYKAEGNLLQFTAGFDTAQLQLVALKTAQLVCIIRSSGLVHGNLGPGAFYLDNKSIAVLNVGLYGQAQQILSRIHWGPAHNYKARAELIMDPVTPTEAMDAHSWGKTMITLFSRSAFDASLGNIKTPTKPEAMPETIWNIVKQCLDESLNVQVNMSRIVRQLEAVTSHASP